MTDAVEATGQHMQQKAADEFVRVERHHLMARPAFGAVIFPAEGNATLVERNQSLIGDRHAMRVTGEVGKHRGRAGEGTFSVNNPFLFTPWRKPSRKGGRLA